MDTQTMAGLTARGIFIDVDGYICVPPAPESPEALRSAALDAIRNKPVELALTDVRVSWIVTDECGVEVGATDKDAATRLVAYYRQRARDYPSPTGTDVPPTMRASVLGGEK